MKYKFFDKKFIVFPDEDCIGKKVFFSDNYEDLLEDVESGDLTKTGTINDVRKGDNFPFNIGNNNWILAYFDPNYGVKVAYSQGRQIQIQIQKQNRDGYIDEWVDVKKPIWSKRERYRVKPDRWFVHPSEDKHGNCIGHPFYKDTSNKVFVSFEGTEEECDDWIEEHTPKTRRMTNRELAKWCADNKGQYKVEDGMCYTQHTYYACDENIQVAEEIQIREWDSDTWHEPLVEVKEEE